MSNKRKWLIAGIIVLIAAATWLIFRPGKLNVPQGTADREIPADSTDELWYKNAVIYTLDVETFQDSDQDGVGDFTGLTQRLGYIDSLGATVIWLQPFQPTPNKDDGYDVSDYYAIDKRYGDTADFSNFIKAANQHGIKVIMDLVLNHTSIEHPWYKSARKDAASTYRSWYVWAKSRPENYDVGMVFPGVQNEIWTYDSLAKEYYYHRFYKFQPDLNTQNPEVQAEVQKIVKHWISKGLYGFRLDAVPFYIEVADTKGDKFEHRFELLTQLRSYLKTLNKNAIILGEANVLPEETEPYFGKTADGIQMMFNFFVNQHLFYALATGEARPLRTALEKTNDIPGASQWGQFLRNHDEVDLGRLTEKQRQKVYDRFGPDSSMQLYDRGIRRRLAPMVNNSRQLLELANSLLFGLPSTPVVRYGDELGMGDDLSLKERESVRTPMQWDNTKNGGFTKNASPVKPPVDTGIFSYKSLNADAEKKNENSLLEWTRKIIALRKGLPEIGYGKRKILETGNDHVLAIRYEWQGRKLVTVYNFSETAEKFNLGIKPDLKTSFKPVLSAAQAFSSADKDNYQLEGHGYAWLREN